MSLLFGIIVTIILPAQEPAGPTELAKPYSEQEARGRDIYLREGCHYCHTQQVRAPEANRGFVRARGDIGPESVPGDFYYQSPVFWGHAASRHGSNPRGQPGGSRLERELARTPLPKSEIDEPGLRHALLRLPVPRGARCARRLHAELEVAMVYPARGWCSQQSPSS